MVYRFTQPAQPDIQAKKGPGSLAPLIMDIRQLALRRAQLEQQKAAEEEAARQAAAQLAWDRDKAKGVASRHEDAMGLKRRSADINAANYALQRARFAMEGMGQEEQLRATLEPEKAARRSALIESLPRLSPGTQAGQMSGGSGPGMGRGSSPLPSGGVGEAVDDALASFDMAQSAEPPEQARLDGFRQGETTPEFAQYISDVQMPFQSLAESGGAVEKRAAQEVMAQAEGMLRTYGDKEKAGKALRAAYDKKVDAYQKEKRARIAASRLQKDGEWSRPDFSKGWGDMEDAVKRHGGEDIAKAYNKTVSTLNMLDKWGSNLKVYGGALYAAVEAISGQSGRAITDADAERLMGEGWKTKAVGEVAQRFEGEAGRARLKELRELLVAGRDKLLDEGGEVLGRIRQQFEGIPGISEASAYRAGANVGMHGLDAVQKAVEERERERADVERYRSGDVKPSKDPNATDEF